MAVLADGWLGPDARPEHLHFSAYAPVTLPYAIERYVKETERLYGVLDRRLANRAFVAGDEYSIVDMAIYPWIFRLQRERDHLDMHPNLKRWADSIAARPATLRTFEIGKTINTAPTLSEESKAILLGQGARKVAA